MVSDQLLKLRALVLCAVVICVYPVFLFAAIVSKIYESLFGRAKSKVVAGDVAVVTGAGHGLGKAIAIELAKQGCHVAIVDINMDEAENTANLINTDYNVNAKAYKVDVSNYEQIVELKDKVSTDLGDATILINNAGILIFSNPNNPDWREVQRMLNVNISSHFWTNGVFLPKMKQLKRGHIVAISSASSLFPLIYNAEYTCTKFAVRGLMRVLRQELKASRHKNIHATTVFPTFLETNAEVAKIVRESGGDAVYPLISGTEAAQRIVEAMLRNEEEIVLPNFLALLYRYFEILPASWQDALLVGPSKTFKSMQRT